MFGKDKVLIRSLDEWTIYQYNLPFEAASPAQQKEALNHYQVGSRLFPARPQDLPARQTALTWLLSLVCFCSFITLSEAVHGWYRAALFLAFYAWLFLCIRLSKRFSDVPATSTLTGLGLS